MGKSKIDWGVIREEWRGKGTIEPRMITETKPGVWTLFFNENGKEETISNANYDELDRLRIEFGGKNPKTIAAPTEFLSLGDWRSEDLYNLGHEVQKICITGKVMTGNDDLPFHFPEGTGSYHLVNSARKAGDPDFVKTIRSTQSIGEITRAFSSRDELDGFVDFMLNHTALKKIKIFIVMGMVTHSIDSGKTCTFHREKAKDGTSRMQLKLIELDGEGYEDCMYFDLVSAADGMFESECEQIGLPEKKIKKDETVCLLAAERGVFDRRIEKS